MSNQYKSDHMIAKFIVCNIVVVLISVAQTMEMPGSLILNGLAVYTWFFGVNFFGHIVESIRKHKHDHDWL